MSELELKNNIKRLKRPRIYRAINGKESEKVDIGFGTKSVDESSTSTTNDKKLITSAKEIAVNDNQKV